MGEGGIVVARGFRMGDPIETADLSLHDFMDSEPIAMEPSWDQARTSAGG